MFEALFSAVGGLLSALWSVVSGVWWLLDFSRRAVINLLLVGLIAGAGWMAWERWARPLTPGTVLVLELRGHIVEQASGSARASLLAPLGRPSPAQMRLRDLLTVLDEAGRDDKITHALLLTDGLTGGGLAAQREVALALERFKSKGKKLYAWGSNFDQRQYYLAAQAQEVWLHPMGAVLLQGFGGHRNYYREALDRLGIAANVQRVGKFKSAAEPFSDNGPTEASQQAEGELLASLWNTWVAGVERARHLSAGHIQGVIAGLPGTLQAAGGDTARLALQSELVTGLKTRDEVRALLMDQAARESDGRNFVQVSMGAYLARLRPDTTGPAVGVVIAEGSVVDGEAPPGLVGGVSTAAQVRRAREDDNVKAVVLRVNSPGGSAFASELVRHELALTRKAGKPVVVSMGDVAASGGYWVALAADEIIADEATVTGSIGVVGMLPSAKGALDKLGVHTGGSSTSWLAGLPDPRRELDPRLATLVQAVMGHLYKDFLGHAARQRKMTVEQVEERAQGRVWSGKDALARGLVDKLGSFGDALNFAAQRAELPFAAHVKYFEASPGRVQQALQRLLGASALDADASTSASHRALLALAAGIDGPTPVAPASAVPADIAGSLGADLAWLLDLMQARQPYAAVAHCLCGAP